MESTWEGINYCLKKTKNLTEPLNRSKTSEGDLCFVLFRLHFDKMKLIRMQWTMTLELEEIILLRYMVPYEKRNALK